MSPENIQAAIYAAQIFIARATVVLVDKAEDVIGFKESGALRRASMELTRARSPRCESQAEL